MTQSLLSKGGLRIEHPRTIARVPASTSLIKGGREKRVFAVDDVDFFQIFVKYVERLRNWPVEFFADARA
jgi:hypothetical protein